ncbi:MAG: ribonuclease III [Streptococcaceae bacterium]|jgi:ribonuclease-3|nr:ribonuclease III [Streptococcaceae bacterium]
MDDLQEKLQAQWGIVFRDVRLLTTAFTHSSYQNEQKLPKIANNERLEFLGDAALQLVISRYLYERFPEKLEGELSKLRSSIVRTESLADFTRRCGFQDFLLLGNGEEKTGGRERDTILENLFEAFLGALLEDQGIEAVTHFLEEVVIPHVELGDYERVTDWKTALQEALQAGGDTEIEYRVMEESGPAHDRRFRVSVFEKGRELGTGEGHSKKLAEQDAAHQAFEKAKERT